MFGLFRKKRHTTLLKAYAYYALYLEYIHNKFKRSGEYLFLTKWNMHYFLFLMEYKHWYMTGELLFKYEDRIISMYGIQYQSLNYEFVHHSLQTSLPSYAEYNASEYDAMYERLTNEDKEMIESFFYEQFLPLKEKRNELIPECLQELGIPIEQDEVNSFIYRVTEEAMLLLFDKLTNIAKDDAE